MSSAPSLQPSSSTMATMDKSLKDLNVPEQPSDVFSDLGKLQTDETIFDLADKDDSATSRGTPPASPRIEVNQGKSLDKEDVTIGENSLTPESGSPNAPTMEPVSMLD